MKAVRVVATALVAVLGLAGAAGASPDATITGGFADACRDFTAHSSKDISHVELHFSDGRAVKDESITTPDHSIDGGAGDEIETAVVKSGRTLVSFACDSGRPPEAVLEIRLSPGCLWHTSDPEDPFYWCLDGATDPERTLFVDPGDLRIDQGCLGLDPLCFTITLRATGSADPDGDLTGWSLDFGDGAVAAGDWTVTPPSEVRHTYVDWSPCTGGYCRITLTVTDSQGRTDTDSILLAFFDMSPD